MDAPGSASPAIELKTVATAYGTGIFKGDALQLVNDGSVAVATTGEAVSYISDGCEQYWTGSELKKGNYLPASTAWGTVRERRSVIRCIPVRGNVFEIDGDDGTTATTEATYESLVNNNCQMTTGAGGSTVSGQSTYALDISTAATTAGEWRIVGISTRPNQDFASSRVKLLVQANTGQMPPFSTTGV
jgi:hypothetical protein